LLIAIFAEVQSKEKEDFMLTSGFECAKSTTPAYSYTHDIIVTPGGSTIEFYKRDGKEHRDDGPASIIRSANGAVTEEYYKDGKRHRDDGPALIVTKQNGEVYESFHINGHFYGTQAPTAERIQEVEARETVRQVAESDKQLHQKSATEVLRDKRVKESKEQLLGLDLIHVAYLLGPAL